MENAKSDLLCGRDNGSLLPPPLSIITTRTNRYIGLCTQMQSELRRCCVLVYGRNGPAEVRSGRPTVDTLHGWFLSRKKIGDLVTKQFNLKDLKREVIETFRSMFL